MREIDRLVAGFKAFRREHFEENRDNFRDLAEKGQAPKILIIACSDSRVDPAIITQAAPGDLFVVRNVANLVPPCEGEDSGHYHGTSAALDFAVRDLSVRHIIVIGHARCGGIEALITTPVGAAPKGFIGNWVSIASAARDKVLQEMPTASLAEKTDACEKEGIKSSLANLMTFPWVAEKVTAGELMLHGWYFDLNAGTLLALDPKNDAFHPIETLFPDAEID
ncbi:MAG: carbonic anhydrase [Rhodospirillaceae bacterium]|jgi:carbonic anhydrase|nr:carbonic anhydrase [Rhodospirillaceae bacterium]MBT5373388.1 carbonic anhydrase [Rhodospirillaceae bacterium]MBT5659345.1 carbonic anhydrase [Rhodospirillaceae bacterium]MBT5752911.1 carbonic anhydrase [Rhodospirillaceae bacterium]